MPRAEDLAAGKVRARFLRCGCRPKAGGQRSEPSAAWVSLNRPRAVLSVSCLCLYRMRRAVEHLRASLTWCRRREGFELEKLQRSVLSWTIR